MKEISRDVLVFKFRDAKTKDIDYIAVDDLTSAEWTLKRKKTNRGSFINEFGPPRSIFDSDIVSEGRRRKCVIKK